MSHSEIDPLPEEGCHEGFLATVPPNDGSCNVACAGSAPMPEEQPDALVEKMAALQVKHDVDGSQGPSPGESHMPEPGPLVPSCSKCNSTAISCLAQCGDCRDWFCNIQDSRQTHLYGHFVDHGHKSLIFPKSHHSDGGIAKCSICGRSDIFDLRFDERISKYHFFCFSNCLALWDCIIHELRWVPLVGNRCISPVVLSTCPSEAPELRDPVKDRRHTGSRMESTQRATLMDSTSARMAQGRVPDIFLSPGHYRSVFEPLIKMEMESASQLSNAHVEQNVAGCLVNDRPGHIDLPHDSMLRVKVGNFLEISHPPSGREVYYFQVIKIVDDYPDGQTVVIVLKHGSLPGGSHSWWEGDFEVKLSDNPIHYLRIVRALQHSARLYKPSFGLLEYILGYPDDVIEPWHDFQPLEMPDTFQAPGISPPNASQLAVMQKVVQRPFSLIQGPPGTGKTATIANLAYFFHSQGRSVHLSAPSNVAVSNMCGRVHASGLDVLWMESDSREYVASPHKHLTIKEKMKNLDLTPRISLESARSGLYSLEHKRKRPSDLRRARREEILKEASIVGATLSSSAAMEREFDVLIIDEATQCTDPEVLVAMMHGHKTIIMVGDQMQLGPVVLNARCMAAGLNRSMFQRLVALRGDPLRLDIQYRMHPSMAAFPAKVFYQGTLENGVTAEQRTPAEVEFPWPDPKTPMMFWKNHGREKPDHRDTSYYNPSEASRVLQVLNRLLDRGVSPDEIGIISPYNGQCRHIRSLMMQPANYAKRQLYKRVEVASVDAFQGSERNYTILSSVRTDHPGFLADKRRLNVAITRARFGMVIIGNVELLRQIPVWRRLIEHYQEQGLLVEGKLDELRVVQREEAGPASGPDTLDDAGAPSSLGTTGTGAPEGAAVSPTDRD
ncbi:hypothetical protein, variant 1 [Fonticula alba]|uniref:Upf1 domain-containing protein n=1 Tax=Fonticula alba TaxID=691883 RepID=A0A058Z9R5_FONAL|nr:hypothetical protein, variant 1 [Fonticula alba]KCV70861.1 hypothetical protein, variant 1 [Fonticula alba]|eukprot:XP_009495378.1 hypothetical protein, variant 1 [Fonticula alba]